MTEIPAPTPLVNVGQVIRDCQRRVSTAYATRGDSQALVALACASIVLQAHVEADSLIPEAIDYLDETATNLGMRRRLGDAFIDIALDCGAVLFDELAAEWQFQQTGIRRQPPTPTATPPAEPLAAKIAKSFAAKMAPGGRIDQIIRGVAIEMRHATVAVAA